MMAADGFRMILEDTEDALSAELHADIKLMYRQRFFIQTKARIVSGYQASKTQPGQGKGGGGSGWGWVGVNILNNF